MSIKDKLLENLNIVGVDKFLKGLDKITEGLFDEDSDFEELLIEDRGSSSDETRG